MAPDDHAPHRHTSKQRWCATGTDQVRAHTRIAALKAALRKIERAAEDLDLHADRCPGCDALRNRNFTDKLTQERTGKITLQLNSLINLIERGYRLHTPIPVHAVGDDGPTQTKEATQ
jgi:hypothetical protein